MLNRRRSAYGYAGQSIRLAHSLGLDKPAPPSLSNVEREHRKRVWWTAYCIDRSTSAELGLRPAFVGMAEGLDYPASDNLTPEEQEEFYNPELLKAQVQVCDLKSYVVETVGRLKSQDIERPYEMIGNCLERLDSCGMALNPSLLSHTSADSTSNAAEARIALSILLRYNQVGSYDDHSKCLVLTCLFKGLYPPSPSDFVASVCVSLAQRQRNHAIG